MMRALRRLAADRAGSSATEMALATPLVIVLFFATFEAGYYFMSEHVLQKAVRDAARYAGRLPMTSYVGCDPAAAEAQIQSIARTGDPDGLDGNGDPIPPRLAGWTSDTMTDVELNCDSDTSNSYVNNGVFRDFPNGGAVPVVTVSASVPYPTLFGTLGFGSVSLTLNARSESPVFGA